MPKTTTVYGIHISWKDHESAVMSEGLPETEFFAFKSQALLAFEQYKQQGEENTKLRAEADEYYPEAVELVVYAAYLGDTRQLLCNLLNREQWAAQARSLRTWSVDRGATDRESLGEGEGEG